MVLAFFGPDSFRRNAALEELRARYRAKHSDLTMARFSLAEEGAEAAFREFMAAGSLFGASKFAELHDSEDVSKSLIAFLKELEKEAARTVVVVGAGKMPKGLSFVEEKHSRTFEPLEGRTLETFIDREARERGAKLVPETKKALIELYEGESAVIINEVEKIALGATMKPHFTVPDFFPLVQSLRAAELRKRLSALAWLLEEEDPAKVFNIAAALLSGEQKQKMADYDVAIKSGKLEYAEALLDFIV